MITRKELPKSWRENFKIIFNKRKRGASYLKLASLNSVQANGKMDMSKMSVPGEDEEIINPDQEESELQKLEELTEEQIFDDDDFIGGPEDDE